MGFWTKILRLGEPTDKKATILDLEKYILGGGATASGAPVTPDLALSCATVYACVRVLAESVAQLPLIVYRRHSDRKERASDHPLYSLLHDAPNDFQTSFEWREMMMGHVLLRGNAYSFINRLGNGRITELLPIHPDRVEVEQADDYSISYIVKGNNNERRRYSRESIFHLKGLSSNGFTGLSPIALARESIGLSLATEKHGAKLFANAARPGGILKHPAKLSEEAARRLKSSWDSSHGSENIHRTAVLEEGMEWSQVGMTSEDAQFLETRSFQIAEIARIFRVPVILLQHADKTATYSSSEQFFLSFVVHTLVPWLKRWEQAISRDLIADSRAYYPEFLVEGLLRGDIKSRYEAYSIGRQWGFLSVNEIREKENLNPIPEGDQYLSPLNMVPLDQVGKEANSNADQTT